LNIRLPMWQRALLTRLVAIIPCVITALSVHGSTLNTAVDIVNVSLAFLLPFALTPLVKYTTSKEFMGEYATGPIETVLAWTMAFFVYAVNAFSLSLPGGGFFGDMLFGDSASVEMGGTWVFLFILMLALQIFFAAWNAYIVWLPITKQMMPLATERVLETEFTVAREVKV